jgi:hypothetical protein
VDTKSIDSIVFAPAGVHGGVKSLYSACEWLSEIGRSSIAPFYDPKELASWFDHNCQVYDYSYYPELLIYPEVCQPRIVGAKFHLCFALGKFAPVKPHANLTVCRSRGILDWVKAQLPDMPTILIAPSINRAVFEYDGRPKKDIICYMTRPDKHPETARLLRERYGDRVTEIVGYSEAEVAETLKNSRVFVWRGHEWEGSPRPPKEALVAGCVVVGLKADLNETYHTDFGIRCSTVDELIEMSGEALKMEIPSANERAVVRDRKQEKMDWFALLEHLDIHGDAPNRLDNNESITNQQSSDRALAVFAANLRSVQADEALVNEQKTRLATLKASLTERQVALESLTTQLAAQRKETESMREELAERNRVIGSLSLQLAATDEMLRASIAQQADERVAIQSLTSLLADKEKALRELADQDASRGQALRTLSSQLAEKVAEIDRITNTLGWRLLRWYGKIKYPYLLPIYRLLGLMSRMKKPVRIKPTKDDLLKSGELTDG